MTAPADPQAAIDELAAREAALEAAIAAERERTYELRTAASFRETEAAGYIDHSYLEKP
ncbi:hypothetical protein TPA0906_65910 [Streptomyces olivaceus]|uniref:hypothetical protein n=1 Tax=Streptomyces olivaceus TaxID=47716 RepID=UPI0022EE1420|nr:hypothetical protein [Streptomyces olivaceus]GHJ04726.1 hypothetical protein TPA0906_65910 [Streptomyces olivaceus]